MLCDTFYSRVVVLTGDRLVYFRCTDSSRTNCERQPTIYLFTEQIDDTSFGRIFLSPEDLRADAASGGCHWRQCRPATGGRPPC